MHKVAYKTSKSDNTRYKLSDQRHQKTHIPKEALEIVEHLKLASKIFTELVKLYGDTATSVSINTR